VRLGFVAFPGPAESYVPFAREHGFEHIEFDLYTLHQRLETFTPERRRRVRSMLDESGLPCSLHAPYSLNLADPLPSLREANIHYCLEALDLGADLGAQWMTLHIGHFTGLFDSEGARATARAHLIESLSPVLERAEALHIPLALENVPPLGAAASFVYLGDSAADFLPLFDHLGPMARLCLDIGHANIGGGPLPYLETLAERLINTHLHDNLGDRDTHMAVGSGTVPWTDALRALQSAGYDGPLNIEVFDDEDKVASLHALRGFLGHPSPEPVRAAPRRPHAVGETVQDIQFLRDCLAQRERELEAVRRITAALHGSMSPEDLVRETLHTAIETVHASSGTVYLHDAETDELVFTYVMGDLAPVLTGRRMPAAKGVVGRVFTRGLGEITQDVSGDEAHFSEIDRETQFHTRNMVTVPLKTTAGKTIGVMQILNKQRGIFTEDDRGVLEILSAQAASAIETAMLQEEAKLATVAKTIGDISHDIKNMVAPSVTGSTTLEMMMNDMWSELDGIGLSHPDAGREIEAATASVRGLFPEFATWIRAGAEAVQERTREIAEAVKGVTSPPEFLPVRATEVVDMVFAHLGMPAEQAGIALVLDAPADLPEADLDAKKLYNAIYNLVNNAREETPSGGRITVHLSAEPDEARNDGGILEIIVADTGRGMPPEIRERLFTKRTKSTKAQGTGIGTQIVKNVVDSHRGRIWVDSAEGCGTTFTIHLPLRQPGAMPRPAP
jgi:sugar phosphate isomerase/epimerase/signal transduction histidine kinase